MPRAAENNRPIESLHGIGPQSARWLREAGIKTEADLRQLGAVGAYLRLKHMFGQRVTLNMLWGLEGALTDTDWRTLSPARKEVLRQEIDQALAARLKE